MNPEVIYKAVSPSVVSIHDVDSSGSGVILSKDGLILTNYHVVASGLPLSVSIKVRKGTDWVEKTYENVEVSKVHPEYDLALLKIEAAGADLQAAKRLGTNDKVVTGSACYAIGNPAGVDGVALDRSITEGLVSAASRQLDGLNYIQTSAALNPGNSGGAVVDNQGRLIGIATFRIDQTDNLGFAIPIQDLQIDQFVKPERRKKNHELAGRYETEAKRIAALAEQMEGDDRAQAILVAAFYFRKCMQEVPDDPAPYHNVGTMYFRLQEDKIARRYFERALQIRPLYASSMSTLGIVIARNNGDPKVYDELWFRGATDKTDPVAASDCVENLAISFINRNELAAAAYCIRWANVLSAPPAHRKSTRSSIWEKGSQTLSEGQFAALKVKDSGFSKKDLEAFVKDKNPKPAIAVAAADNDKSNKVPAAVNGKAFIEVARKQAEAAVAIPAGGMVKPLPAKPVNAIMGYAGTCLLITFPDLMKIGVYDLCQTKIVKYIDLPEKDAIVAAGGKMMLLYLPGARRFELWDMETWTKKKEVVFRSDRTVVSVGMGLLNHEFAVVVCADGNAQARDKVAILSLPDCKLTVPEVRQLGTGMDLFHCYAHIDKSSRVVLEESGTCALVLGSGRGFFKLGNHQSVEACHQHTGGSQDASIVFGGTEMVVTNFDVYRPDEEGGLLQKAAKESGSNRSARRECLANVYGYRGTVEIDGLEGEQEARLCVRSLPQLNPVYSQPVSKELYKKIDFGGDKQMFASAYVNRCAILSKDAAEVLLFGLDTVPVATADQIVPGSLFTRKLTLAEGTKATVDSGPNGLTYDLTSGEIRWQIPKDQPRSVEVSVILLLTDALGKESYHVEKIYIP